MKPLRSIFLKKGREKALERFHPWIFSGAIDDSTEAEAGDLVAVYSAAKKFLCIGHFQKESIAVKILSFSHSVTDAAFWELRIRGAFELRLKLELLRADNNMFRLCFGEGDLLPGLVLDYYAGVVVMQCHSIGMYRSRQAITDALKVVLGKQLIAVYCKSKDSLPRYFAAEAVDEYLFREEVTKLNQTLENGIPFQIDVETGQKTGFFIDQRENRKLLESFSAGKRVLNTFCYSGGFSLYALRAGAKQVTSVDSSRKAIELTDQNVQLNGFTERHESVQADIFDYLKQDISAFDLVLLDPPAFAKNIGSRHNALMGYKRLNSETMRKMKSGSILFTFSCSQVVDRRMFSDIVMAAAIDSQRSVRILHHLSQPADHPVNIFHPEGEYLKGLVLYID